LAISLLPFLAVYFVAGYWRALRNGVWVMPRLPRPVVPGVLLIVGLFAVARNIFAITR